MFTDAENIKYELDILDKMIDHVQRKIRSTENIMGMLNSSYEYETFVGYKPDMGTIAEAKLNSMALAKMLTYRSDLMDYASGIEQSAPSLDLTNISVTLEGNTYEFKF